MHKKDGEGLVAIDGDGEYLATVKEKSSVFLVFSDLVFEEEEEERLVFELSLDSVWLDLVRVTKQEEKMHVISRRGFELGRVSEASVREQR